jgi:hypothetical protein
VPTTDCIFWVVSYRSGRINVAAATVTLYRSFRDKRSFLSFCNKSYNEIFACDQNQEADPKGEHDFLRFLYHKFYPLKSSFFYRSVDKLHVQEILCKHCIKAGGMS